MMLRSVAFVLFVFIIQLPAMAAEKGLIGALIGAGAGAAIGHSIDRSGGSGKGAVIGALGGYVIGSQLEKSEQQAAPQPTTQGAKLGGAGCRNADELVNRASHASNDDKVYFLERAVKLCPQHAQAHNDLGAAYYTRNQRHDLERARSEFNEALRINPNYTVARNNLRRL